MKYYTDGSSTIGVKSAFIVTDEKGNVLQKTELKAPDDLSNNQEEYRGVIAALEMCNAGDEICTDSLLVVNQVSGRYKIKADHLKRLCADAKSMIALKQAKLTWVPREDNKAGKHFE